MLLARIKAYRPSLRRWTRAFAAVWLLGAGIMMPVAVYLLEQIYNDARSTYTTEIPSLLDRDRKALKLERLSSFIGTVAAAQDPRVERHVFLQFQALAQGVDLDNDVELNETVARAVTDVKRIMAAHAALRRLTPDERAADGGDRPPARAALEGEARRIADEAVAALNSAADNLTTGSALTADNLANRIQQNASWVERGSLVALAIVVASGILILWFFHRHVLAPIRVAVQGLEVIRGSDGAPVTLPRSLFFELDVIGRAVEQYARFAADLRTANLALRRLSRQDGLTGVTNRRGFDLALAEACRAAQSGAARQALLLVDIDHFKSLNDRFGHLVGDQCLRQVAETLQGVSAACDSLVSRYGGEEFAILVSNLGVEDVRLFAERVREAVEGTALEVGPGQRRHVTVSIGGLAMRAGDGYEPDRAVALADQALYKAKRDGRNRVCLSAPQGASAAEAQSAA